MRTHAAVWSSVLAMMFLTAPTHAVASPVGPDASVVEIPVAFTVDNTNTSGMPCVADGEQYTVHGHLIGPDRLLAATRAPALAVYLFGLDAGEWNLHFPDD